MIHHPTKHSAPFLLLLWGVYTGIFSAAAAHSQGDAEAVFKHGLAQYRLGKYVSARIDFRTLIDAYPYSPQVADAYVMLAKTLYCLDAFAEADSVSTKLRTIFPHSRYGEWTFYLQAACAYRTGNMDAALASLARLAGSSRDSTLKASSLRALKYVIQPLCPPERFAKALDSFAVDRAALDSAPPYAGSLFVPQIEREPSPAPPGKKKPWELSPSFRIGLLSPLSGSNAELGLFLLKGVKAALAGQDSIDGKPIELIVEDIESDPVVTVLKVRKLAEQGVVAIIGPVFSITNITGAVESNTHGIPFIAPTATDAGLTNIGNGVFQLNFTPSVEAVALADFAVNVLSVSRAAIIASRDPWGMEMARVFAREIEKRNARIIRTTFFTPDSETEDMTGIMKELRTYAPKPPAFSDSTLAGSTVALPDTVESDSTYYSSRTLTPITSIDAVLISAATSDAVKIASRIMEYNIQTVLLGDSGWSDLSVPEDGKRFIEGSYLIAPFGTLSGGIGSSLIQGAALNDDRETVAMKGYDAAAVLLRCIRQGARNPEEIIHSLETTRDFRGSSSVISFDPSHHANTAVAFIRIKNGIFQKVQRIKNTER